MIRKLARILAKFVFGFVALSLALVVLFKWLPVPITATMVLDPKVWDEGGLTKDWESLDNIDRNLVRAVIAGEDGKFCLHSGFDTEAIAKTAARNAHGGRIRGGSTITQHTDKHAYMLQGGGFLRKGTDDWLERKYGG